MPVVDLTSAGTWFRSTYPAAVGVARRVLDPDSSVPASLAVAEELAVAAMAAVREPEAPQLADRATTAAITRVVDLAGGRLRGHPGSVPLRYELDEHDLAAGFDGRLSLAELHDALVDAARWDRRVGLVALAGGLAPDEIALLFGLERPEVADRLERVAGRLADGRRIGRAG